MASGKTRLWVQYRAGMPIRGILWLKQWEEVAEERCEKAILQKWCTEPLSYPSEGSMTHERNACSGWESVSVAGL